MKYLLIISEGPTYLTLAIMSPTHAVRLSPPLSSMGGGELEISHILIWLRRPSTGCPKKVDNRISRAILGEQIFGGHSRPNICHFFTVAQTNQKRPGVPFSYEPDESSQAGFLVHLITIDQFDLKFS